MGIMWSQRLIIDGWMLKVRCNRDVRRWSGVHGVTSVPYSDQDGGTTVSAVNAASTEPEVERSIVDNDTANNMFGIESFVELGQQCVNGDVHGGE